jgi:hypothetical protein
MIIIISVDEDMNLTINQQAAQRMACHAAPDKGKQRELQENDTRSMSHSTAPQASATD